eukprot:6178759-Pleurochrysis_carterae.AAC.1
MRPLLSAPAPTSTASKRRQAPTPRAQADGRFAPAVEGEGLGRLTSAEGFNEVGRAACALQPSGKSDAERVPAIARGFLRAQTISKQGGEEFVGLRGHDSQNRTEQFVSICRERTRVELLIIWSRG